MIERRPQLVIVRVQGTAARMSQETVAAQDMITYRQRSAKRPLKPFLLIDLRYLDSSKILAQGSAKPSPLYRIIEISKEDSGSYAQSVEEGKGKTHHDFGNRRFHSSQTVTA